MRMVRSMGSARLTVILAICALLITLSCGFGTLSTACASEPATPPAAETTVPTDTPADPLEGAWAENVEDAPTVMPNLVGMNYADALEVLHALGIEKVDVLKHAGNADVAFNPFGVLNPRNWTVQSQSIPAGGTIDPDCTNSETRPTLALVRSAMNFDGVDIAAVLAGLFGN